MLNTGLTERLCHHQPPPKKGWKTIPFWKGRLTCQAASTSISHKLCLLLIDNRNSYISCASGRLKSLYIPTLKELQRLISYAQCHSRNHAAPLSHGSRLNMTWKLDYIYIVTFPKSINWTHTHTIRHIVSPKKVWNVHTKNNYFCLHLLFSLFFPHIFTQAWDLE